MTPSTYLYAQKCRFFHGFCTFCFCRIGKIRGNLPLIPYHAPISCKLSTQNLPYFARILQNKGFRIPLWSRNQFRKQIILSF